MFFAFADFQDGFLSFSEFSTGALLLYQDALEDELHVLFSGSWVLLMKNGRDCDLFFHGIQFCSLDSISVSFPLKRLKRVRCELVVIEFTARSKSIEPFNKKETLGMGQVATANKVQTCFQVLVKSMFHRCRDWSTRECPWNSAQALIQTTRDTWQVKKQGNSWTMCVQPLI